jgi:glycosyltransferase involved in cell wall biosynthesis
MKAYNMLLSVPGFFPHSFGGGQTYVYRLVKELQKRGYQVTVVTPVAWREGDAPYVLDKCIFDGINIITFSLNPGVISYAERELDFGPVTCSALREIAQQYLPDIVHINGTKAAWVKVCNEMKVPHVLTAHHVGLVCSAGGLLLPDGSLCTKEIIPVNCVPCCNWQRRPKWYTGSIIGLMPSWIYRPLGNYLRRKERLSYIERGLITPWLVEESMRIKKEAFQKCGPIIAPSKYMLDLLVSNGCDLSKMVLVPHAIEPMGKMSVDNLAGRAVRFGYIGRIDSSKGLHILLSAAELLPDDRVCEIHIFGGARNAGDQEYLQKTLAQYKGKAVVYSHGIIEQGKMAEAYAKIDVLVVPSRLPEAFGLVVMEAFSTGRPVVVADIGALAENIRDGVDGFVVERNDHNSLALAMQRFIERPQLINEMSGKIRPVKTITEYADEVETLYNDIIGRSKT